LFLAKFFKKQKTKKQKKTKQKKTNKKTKKTTKQFLLFLANSAVVDRGTEHASGLVS